MPIFGLIGVISLYGLVLYWNHEEPAFIGDAQFVADANEVCARYSPLEPAGSDATSEERAFAVEELAAMFTNLTEKLALINVVESDQSAVSAWITDIEDYIDVGYAYAQAIRTGDSEQYVPIGNNGDELATRILEFAAANEISECEGLISGP